MEPTIFGFLKRYAWKQQVLILMLTALTLPLGYATLELPKLIINRALGTDSTPQFFDIGWERLDLLWTLCGLFLIVVLISGGLKYIVNVYAGIVSERMLRRMRYQLIDHVLRFPLPHLKRLSQGELVQMINAEVEPLGGFVGQAVTTPGLQGGTLLISLTFMFAQDPILGMAAVALYPLQIWLIPKLQAKVNLLGKARVRQVRRNAEQISEMAASVRDIRGNNATVYEQSQFSGELARVFEIRLDIYKKKFLIKFLNNFLAQLGPFFFYAIGGYLVIQGDLTVGALVAVIGAQKDIASPWKELLAFYQTVYDVRIKYDQVVNQFVPQGMRDPNLIDPNPADPNKSVTPVPFDTVLRLNHVSLQDEDGGVALDGVSLNVDLPSHMAIVGPSGAGKDELMLCLAGLLHPTGGRIFYGEHDVADIPESEIGRKVAFVGNPTQIFGGTMRDNLLYGLVHRPVRKADDDERRKAYLTEAVRAGNSSYYPEDEWTDFDAIGLGDKEQRLPAMIDVLKAVHLDSDAYMLGLRANLERPQDEDLEALVLEARKEMARELAEDPKLSKLVEPFDPDLYNTNASLAENLLFGTTVSDVFDLDKLAENDYLRDVLNREGLTDELISVGYRLAATMVEIFADLPPDHEYFRQFSFIDAEELPDFRNLIGRVDISRLGDLSDAERIRLLSLPFKLVPARHRLGMLDDDLRKNILKARRTFRNELPESLKGGIEFFDPATYNHKATLQDNILFGKVAYGQAQSSERIAGLIAEILERLGLRNRVIEVGLRTECGLGGGRLSQAQRQKLGIGRALMKQPDILLMSDATGALDKFEGRTILETVLERMSDRTIIWALQEPELARQFRELVVLRSGSVVEKGTLEDLDQDGSEFSELLSR